MLLNFLASTAFGIMSGLGIGGGSLMILWLTVIRQSDFAEARIINLFFFIAAASFSTIIHFIRKDIPIKAFLIAAIPGCLSAALLSAISRNWDHALLQKSFGIIILISSIRELLYKKSKPN